MNEIKDMEDTSVGERNITNLWFSKDAIILADSERLQGMLDKLNLEGKKRRLRVNIGKIEVMRTSKDVRGGSLNVVLEGQKIWQVDRFIDIWQAWLVKMKDVTKK